MIKIDVNGFTKRKPLGNGSGVNVNVGLVRLRDENNLDVVVEGDGSKNVLEIIQTVLSTIINATMPDPLTPEWSELARVPQSGTQVVVTVGVRTEFEEGI